MHKILYVDDSEINLEYFGEMFSEDFEVELVQNPIGALGVLAEKNFDAVILDIHMPLCDGFELYKRIRERNLAGQCPVLFFTSDNTEKTTLKGLKAGADDYLLRSMSQEELFLRISNRIKKYKAFSQDILKIGNIKINKKDMQAYLNKERINLTSTEFKLLLGLAANQGKIVSRDDISSFVWGEGSNVQVGTLNTHIANLRSKLDGFSHKITSLKGRGFILKELPADSFGISQ
ncbi:response regulator receiver domain protein [Bacteriovorax sp. BSW11_IV]|uniref:response regulator transcription factor n=1 Tax=Bacteriovorax sp. BSW11_IV TaxID=1353529 RepID=UPI00038A4684|nr:response regulator transcription factor [Bacteriovorax sp. BSW11_IV]EQC48366.1 response regulator receiver domain protein [Bacteriovorax sp. BSW11_IV]